jgi:hypothetical protein
MNGLGRNKILILGPDGLPKPRTTMLARASSDLLELPSMLMYKNS